MTYAAILNTNHYDNKLTIEQMMKDQQNHADPAGWQFPVNATFFVLLQHKYTALYCQWYNFVRYVPSAKKSTLPQKYYLWHRKVKLSLLFRVQASLNELKYTK